MRADSCRPCLAVVLTALILALWPDGDLIAQDEASRTLTILALRCPTGYAGTPAAGTCNTPVGDVVFRVGRPFTDFFIIDATDAEGKVQFEIAGLPLRGTLRLIEHLPPATERFAADCVDEAGDPLEITYEDFPQNLPPIGVANVAVGDVGDVHCEWYNVPAAP